MNTYKDLIYMIADELKLFSVDAPYTEDHIIYLLGKYIAFLLKQRYADIKKQIPESNYQTICLDLIEVPAIAGEICEGGSYLRSTEKIPYLMKLGNPMVYPIDYYQGNITYISREQMRYIGFNKYFQNVIYASLGPDNYLYFKSSNPQFVYLKQAKLTGIFSDPQDAFNLQCPDNEGNKVCDLLDMEFPIEDALVPPMIELIVKELLGASYRPEDTKNNAADDLSNVQVKE